MTYWFDSAGKVSDLKTKITEVIDENPQLTGSDPGGRQRNEKKNLELHLKDWKRSLAWKDKDFAHDGKIHPHRLRRAEILKKHPEIRLLYGYDTMTLPKIAFAVACQLMLAWMYRSREEYTNFISGNIGMTLIACAIGGSLSSFLAIALHECTHDLVSKNPLVCKAFALLCNVGTPVPIAMSFRRYHADHHAYQGCEIKDPDMPLEWERNLISGTIPSKLLWLIIYPIMYGVRATVRGRSVTPLEITNLVFTIVTDMLILYFWGLRSMTYLLISFAFGYTFHPVAAHFLQEHYTFSDGQETYDYYGWANTYFLNMGFHNEHHDFPAIPGTRLPFVTLIASEYYRPMKCHRSWRYVLWNFLTDSNIGPQSRCARVS